MSDATPKTKPKLLVILGAGSSVELGMPSVGEIDELLLGPTDAERVQPKRPGFFSLVWENRKEVMEQHDGDSWKASVKPNYERCLGDLHALMNGTFPSVSWSASQSKRLCDALGCGSDKHKLPDSLCTDTQIELEELLAALAEHFRQQCNDFQGSIDSSRKGPFSRYRSLFAALRDRFDLGVYNLNHDTVALTALGDVYTGFGRPNGRFQAAQVQCRQDWDFLYHLHGSVHHNLGHPDGTPFGRLETPEICWAEQRNSPPARYTDAWRAESRSDNRRLVQSTLVAGGWKLDQLQTEPFQTFYSTFPRHAHEADAILIAGYGFGDEHVNSVLKNLFKAREGKRPPVIVIDFREVKDRPLEGERCKGFELLEIEDSCWQSDLRTSLNVLKRDFHRAKCLEGPLAGKELGEPVRSKEYAMCFEDAYPVAVWFGGMLGNAMDKDEFESWKTSLADWLLRHVPTR